MGRAVGNGVKDDEKKHPCLFRNSISFYICYAFLHFRLLSGNDGIAEGGIMQLARLHVLVNTALTGLRQIDNRGGHRQKVYANTFTSPVSETVDYHIGQVCRFVKV